MKHLVNLKKQRNGFTMVEVVVALALVSIFAIMVTHYSSTLNKNSNIHRSNNTKNRILSGIRDLAGMPASLRVSMRASANGVAVNPKLLACAGGNPANGCKTGELVPFTLFSPIIQRSNTGTILGAVPIAAPSDSTTPTRIDTFGAPCPTASLSCPLLVSTSFKAQCGPPPLPATPPSPVTVQLIPMENCTIADVIEVTYNVKLDESVGVTDPELLSFIAPISGTVVVPVVKISGNVPQ